MWRNDPVSEYYSCTVRNYYMYLSILHPWYDQFFSSLGRPGIALPTLRPMKPNSPLDQQFSSTCSSSKVTTETFENSTSMKSDHLSLPSTLESSSLSTLSTDASSLQDGTMENVLKITLHNRSDSQANSKTKLQQSEETMDPQANRRQEPKLFEKSKLLPKRYSLSISLRYGSFWYLADTLRQQLLLTTIELWMYFCFSIIDQCLFLCLLTKVVVVGWSLSSHSAIF